MAHQRARALPRERTPPGRALLGARLQLRGQDCAFVAPGRRRARRACRRRCSVALRGSAAGGLAGAAALELSVELRGEGSVSLLGFVPADASPRRSRSRRPSRPERLDVRGAFLDYPPAAPRIVLLNHMWRIAPGFGWLAGLVGLGVLLAVAGFSCFRRARGPGWPLPDNRTLVRASLARRALRGEPGAAPRGARAAIERPRRALPPARLFGSRGRRSARARHGRVDGRDAPVADPPAAGRAIPLDRRRPALRRRGRPAARRPKSRCAARS